MAILGNKYNLIEEEIEEEKDSYTIPAVIRKDEKELTLKKSILISSILHPTIAGMIWLVILILALMGITLSIFERPQPKMNDIEFVLVDDLKEQPPLNKKTKFRADKNTRTGGKRDLKKKVSMPSPAPGQRSVQQKSAPAKKSPAVQQKPQKQIQKKTASQSQAPKRPTEARPQPPTARPSLRPPSTPKLSQNPKPQFAIPVPKSSAPQSGYHATGPIGGSGSSTKGGGSSGRYAPVPSLAPTGSGSGSSGGSRLSKGGGGYGNAGNPGGGGGAPGIDAIREPDFGPYMRELQRRIKMNWDPPKGNESKRVVLLFKIARDGRLLSVRVFKSSGLPNADKAALNAVELTAPFKPLPPEFKGQSIDIQFTFDYNVFGASQY